MSCKNIVIVTHSTDWEQCQTLLDSIDFWLVGCQVVLVDNTADPINLTYTMSNNTLRILSWDKVIPQRVMHTPTYDNGWVSQQLIKLRAHQLFTGDYVVLDSTDIILKSFVDWPATHGRHFPDTGHSFYKFYKSTYRLLGFNQSQKITHATTPFMFNCNQVKDMLSFWSNWDEFEQWFCSFRHPSEFWLYDLWLKRQGIDTYTEPYKPQPLLQLFTWDDWVQYQQNPQWGHYLAGSISREVWNDNRFPHDEILKINMLKDLTYDYT